MDNIKSYTKFLTIAYIIATILLCLASVIFAYTSINDNLLVYFVFGIIIISDLIGSMFVSRKIKRRGFITGLLFGIIYFLIIYLISMIFYTGFFFNEAALMYLITTGVAGIIGGVIGVNI